MKCDRDIHNPCYLGIMIKNTIFDFIDTEFLTRDITNNKKFDYQVNPQSN